MSSSFQNINFIQAPIISDAKEIVPEALFSFMRFDAVIAQVLDVAILPVGMIPFKDVPVRIAHLLGAILSHGSETYNER